ncbi:MAG: Alpha/Beta hydrolase protein, partial [Olpidium bornovanus]
MADSPSTKAIGARLIIQYPGSLPEPVKQCLIDAGRLSWLAYRDPSYVHSQFQLARNESAKLDEGAGQVLRRASELPDYVEEESCDAQCYLVKYKAPPDAEGLGKKPVLAICVRGTNSVTDFVCDVTTIQVPFQDCEGKIVPGASVHSGFRRQFDGLFPHFDERVVRHLRSGGNLFCTGHSMGGAVAAMAALSYGAQYPGQVYFIGQGTPRCGNQAFAKAFDNCVKLRYRVKNASDPVVEILPPLEYCHVGVEVHLGPKDNYPSIPVLFDLPDHQIALYVKYLLLPDAAKETAPPRWKARPADAAVVRCVSLVAVVLPVPEPEPEQEPPGPEREREPGPAYFAYIVALSTLNPPLLTRRARIVHCVRCAHRCVRYARR